MQEASIEQLRIWYVNGSIDLDEFERRVAERLAQMTESDD